VPVVVQTNNQADDLARRLGAAGLHAGRLVGSTHQVPPEVLTSGLVEVSRRWRDLDQCEVTVSTAKKWAWCNDRRTGPAPQFPLGIIDEAYQMRSDALFAIANIIDRALAVGDPGQLDPFTTIDGSRWAGQALGPLATAAGVLLRSHPHEPLRLPVSWRLPPSAAAVVADAFYDRPFSAGTLPGERALHLDRIDIGGPADRILDEAAAAGWGYWELPAKYTGHIDAEIVAALTDLAVRLFLRDAQTVCEDAPAGRRLAGSRVAVVTAHRDQAEAVRGSLRDAAAERGLPELDRITVDTANRLQGREYDVVLAWHPLAGRRDATEFHLESGRLCVMISRHRHACVIVGRAGIGDLLDAHPLAAPVYLDLPAKLPDGWEANQTVLDRLLGHRAA
jgi:superfamily I DNA and/or RNA helicase